MPSQILTQVKMKFNFIRKLVAVPRFYGPLLTLIAGALYHAGHLFFGYTVAVFPLAVFLAIASLFGLRSGLVCAAVLSAYAFYAIPDDPSRVVQIWFGSFLMATIIGSETRALRSALAEAKWARVEAQEQAARAEAALERAERNEEAARTLGALNGNIFRVRHSRNLILKMLEHHPLDELTREEMRQVLHVLNNLEQATAGWQELAAVKERLDRDDNG